MFKNFAKAQSEKYLEENLVKSFDPSNGAMENGRYDEDDDDIVSNSQPATQPLNHPLDDTSEDESSSEETDTVYIFQSYNYNFI